jgi:colanic acid biosynthesis protein WcaH
MLDECKFKEVLKNTPLVAIDLLVIDSQDQILLGLRSNEPGKGYWSVPGGRIYKDETLKNAFNRISHNELGIIFDMKNLIFKGVYEHFYNQNFFQEENINTHYITIACEIRLPVTSSIQINSQHIDYKFFEKRDLLESPFVLENTKKFFDGEYDDLFTFQTK